jgi:GNAT superfamily N-acetyltransferase
MAIVRTATEKDIPRILELYRQLAFEPPPANAPGPSLEECRKVFNSISTIPGYNLLVAEENGEILGTTVLAILPGMAHGTSPFAVVEYVVVDEKHRGKGIGRMLMEYVIARSREAGCYKIMLTSDKRRKEAHQFYRALGFETSAHGFRLYF